MEEIGFGKMIKNRRLELDLSLKELGAKLDCKAPYLSELENGKQIPSDSMVTKIANVLNLDCHELLGKKAIIKIAKMTSLPEANKEMLVAFYKRKSEESAASN